ncbi:MAG: sulfatase [Verrucomicrobia bacterium]|nr:sulfatase [Verrucomicrobiota bacterium]
MSPRCPLLPGRRILPSLLASLLIVSGVQPNLAAAAATRPHILLFIADDVSWNDLGCTGNPTARTPQIDRLAARGRRFDAAYLTASSCSPSRSSIVTGRYPHNNGRASELHQPIAARLPWFPRLLREAGYYTALSGKHHMTSEPPAAGEPPPPKAFDLVDTGRAPGNSGGHANWVKVLQERPREKPFFGWFASYDAHRDWDGDAEWRPESFGPPHQPEAVSVPPFLRDDPVTRRDLASYQNEVTRFDHFIGQVVAELERQEALANTLILILADNGRPFPRAKTRLHDSGMKTYLIAHWPEGIAQPGQPTSSLVSAIDIAPTVLAAAGVAAAPTMQGVSFLPVLRDPGAEVRRHAFSEHNWHDYEAHGRAVRSEGFLYIRNHRPALAWQGPADSVRSPSHQALRAARDARQLTAAQADVFLAPRPEEELYETARDPNQLKNLAADPAHAAVRARLARLLADWTRATADTVPARLSRDSFDRETGAALKAAKKDFRGTPPGWERQAWTVDAPGPR